MRVLLINQFFWPDNAATSQLLTDVAQDLVKGGHTVEVICGGTYARTDIPESLDDVSAVVVHRVSGMSFSRSTLGRILSYSTFYLSAALRAMSVRRPDVVLTLTTPPLISVVGAVLKLLRGVRFCIWEMDLYPDVAVSLGYVRANGLVDILVGSAADWSRRRADCIIALGECMQERLVDRGIDPANIAVVHNWADSTKIQVIEKERGRSLIQIVYSGNLGLAHDIDTVLDAIRILRDDSRFHFMFIGGGARRETLEEAVAREGIKSVGLRPYVPRESLSESLGFCDIGLVTQREECCGAVVPSKVYGLLAAGRPVLYVGPEGATPARIIRAFNCGWHVPLNDSVGLSRLLLYLADHPEEIRTAGRNGRLALEENFDRELGTSRIIAQLLGESSTVSTQATPLDYGTIPLRPPHTRGHS